MRPLAEFPYLSPEQIEAARREREKPMSFGGWVLGSIMLLIAVGLVVAWAIYWIYCQNHVPGIMV